MRSRTKAPRGKPESQVSREVVQALAVFAGSIELDRQNTGGVFDSRGQFVRFGKPGNSDFSGMIRTGPRRGSKFDLEVKREDFRPDKARGETLERFRRQLERLARTNDNGGVGLWVNDAAQLFYYVPRILAGEGIAFTPHGYPYLCQ